MSIYSITRKTLAAICAATLILAGATADAQDFSSIQFSEFAIDLPGGDQPREFIEISGPAGASLDGLTILEIEGDGAGAGGAGTIEGVLDLTGFNLGSNGLLLIRDGSTIMVGDDITAAVLNSPPAPETTIIIDEVDVPGDFNNNNVVDAADFTVWRDAFAGVEGVTLDNDITPESVSIDDYLLWQSNFGQTAGGFFAASADGLENGSITLAIVENFTGASGDDIDDDDDGVLNTTLPFGNVLDAIGFDENGPPVIADPDGGGDLDDVNISFGAALGGLDFDGAQLASNIMFFGGDPGGFARINDGAGGTIPAVFNIDVFGTMEPTFGFGIDAVIPGLPGEVPLDLFLLGPFGISNIFSDDQVAIPLAFATFDENGDLLLINPDLEPLEGDDLGAFLVNLIAALEEAGLIAVGSVTPDDVDFTISIPDPATSTVSVVDGDPVELFLLTPGNVNGSGTLGANLTNPPAGVVVPEPATFALLLVSAGCGLSARRRHS